MIGSGSRSRRRRRATGKQATKFGATPETLEVIREGDDGERTTNLSADALALYYDLAGKYWNEADHPRHPKGTKGKGGKFAKKLGMKLPFSMPSPGGSPKKGPPPNAGGGGGGHQKPLHPELKTGKIDTEKLHAQALREDARRTYRKERKALHDGIVGKFLDHLEPRNDPPRALFTAGGPASGKSGGMDLVPDMVPVEAARIDPDLVREHIPEYQQMIAEGDPNAAAKVHEEAASVSRRIQNEAIRRGLNVVNDGTGNGSSPSWFTDKLRAMDKAGYDVSVIYVDAPTEEAIKRADERAKKLAAAGEPPRTVPEWFTRKAHRNVSRNFPAVVAEPYIDRIVLFDNSGPEGESPRMIAEKLRGDDLEVHDGEAYRKFLKKREETWTDPKTGKIAGGKDEPKPSTKPHKKWKGSQSGGASGGSQQTTTGWTSQSQSTTSYNDPVDPSSPGLF